MIKYFSIVFIEDSPYNKTFQQKRFNFVKDINEKVLIQLKNLNGFHGFAILHIVWKW